MRETKDCITDVTRDKQLDAAYIDEQLYAIIDGDNIMKLSCVRISNYRNIDDIFVDFHPESNYIIGENNLGKSNFFDFAGGCL